MKKQITVKTPFGNEIIGNNNNVSEELSRITAMIRKYSEASSLLLSGLNEYLQSDWDDDTKEKINNPKEYYDKKRLIKENEQMPEVTSSEIDILKQCKVEGNVVKLPTEKVDKKLYQSVKKRIELIGGTWKGGKIFGFVFEEDPTELLNDIANGKKRNLQKETQFFGTSDDLCDDLVFEAQIEPNHKFLEPSAGRGAIIKAIHRLFSDAQVDYCELVNLNCKYLSEIENTTFLCDDFLKLNSKPIYDRIIANPPFSNNQDIEHILKMYSLLKKGGRLVSVASNHWRNSMNRKECDFRDWLREVKADLIDIEAGSFKESGTNIKTVMIIINKK